MVRGIGTGKGQQSSKQKPHPSESASSSSIMNEMDLDDVMNLAAGGDDIRPLHPDKKRSSSALDEHETDFGRNEMQKMLEGFGADISKTLLAKRKRLQQYTQSSLKSTHKKIEETLQNQHGERERLITEFDQHIGSVFQQWETDLTKSKDNEDKLLKLINQQQKLLQQTRIAMQQRLKTAKQLQEHFTKGMRDLGKVHQDQQSGVQAELAKEMAVLQKKILMDTQQQEMANVRKNLQTMLF